MRTASTRNSKKRKRAPHDGEVVEDLDLDVTAPLRSSVAFDGEDPEEARVVHDLRHGANEVDLADVQPSDAYRFGDGKRGEAIEQEEEELAIATGRKLRKDLREVDFPLLEEHVTAPSKKPRHEAPAAPPAAEMVERVEQDFAALSQAARIQILASQSPELLKLLQDFGKYIAEVRSLSPRLQKLRLSRQRTASEKNIISFLETKVQLLLSYCLHVSFYLLMKCEGAKVKGHPVIQRLLELRVYLEKLWSVEGKLREGINRLLSATDTTGGGELNRAHRPQAGRLRPVLGDEAGGIFRRKQTAATTDAALRRKREEQAKLEAAVEREEEEAFVRLQRPKPKEGVVQPNHPADEGFREAEDHFFRAVARSNDEPTETEMRQKPLLDQLRDQQKRRAELEAARMAAKSKPARAEESSAESDDGGEDGPSYAELLEQEGARQQEKHRDEKAPAAHRPEREMQRRGVTADIEKHRGLTRARRKDRKNPRTNQRHKFARGERVSKAQTKRAAFEPGSGFEGVKGLKSHITHTMPLA